MATGRIRRGLRNLAVDPLIYADAVRWFAAEHLLADGRPTDIDTRFDTDMLRFESVRDWELVGRLHLWLWLVRLGHRQHKDAYVNNQYRCLQ